MPFRLWSQGLTLQKDFISAEIIMLLNSAESENCALLPAM